MVRGSPTNTACVIVKFAKKTLASEVTGFLFEMEIGPLRSPGHPSAVVRS